MGIIFSVIPFLDRCLLMGGIKNPVLALGSLEIHEPQEQILSFGKKNDYQNLLRDKSVRSLFLDRYNIDQYQDCDINEQADIHVDLNFAINQNLTGVAATILDGGTLEHLFDIKQAFVNIHRMTRLGGTIIHISPLTWFNHGFYNFNPKLFKGMIQSNGYKCLLEAFLIPPNPKRFFWQNKKFQMFITFDGKDHPEATKMMERYFYQHLIPARSLYMIAYKKENDNSFQYPYDL